MVDTAGRVDPDPSVFGRLGNERTGNGRFLCAQNGSPEEKSCEKEGEELQHSLRSGRKEGKEEVLERNFNEDR